MEPISIRLDADIKATLQQLAADDERSLSSYINRALREHVESLPKQKRRKEN